MGWFSEDSDQANAYDQVSTVDVLRRVANVTLFRLTTPPTRLSSRTSSSLVPLPTRLVQHRPAFRVDILGADTMLLQAAKAYEKHCAANGKPESHAEAKELL